MKRVLTYFFIIQLLAVGQLFSQSYKFKFFDLESGLPELFIYDIIQDSNGYLWIATGSGLVKFDGINFKVYNQKSNLPSAFITKCFIDTDNVLWLGHNNGQISFYKDGKFSMLAVNDTLNSTINDIEIDNSGNIWFAAQSEGLLKLGTDEKTYFYQIKDLLLYAIYPIDSSNIIIGTNEGVFIYNITENQLIDIENNPYSAVYAFAVDNSGKIWFCAEDDGLYNIVCDKNCIAQKVNTPVDLNNIKSMDIKFDVDGNLWLSTFGNGVFQLIIKDNNIIDYVNYNQNNGLITNNIKCVYQDKEKIFWFGTYGEGLGMMSNDYFKFYKNHDKSYSNNYTALFSYKDYIIAASEGNIIRFNTDSINNWEVFNLFNDRTITSLYYDAGDIIWVGTAKNGLYKYNLSTGNIEKINLSEDFLTNSINYIDKFGNHLWIATKNGIVKYNIEAGEVFIYNTSNGLPHNNINSINIDNNENVWIATQSNYVYVLTSDTVKRYEFTDSKDIIKINAVMRDKNGRIWVASYGNGVFVADNNGYINLTVENGLSSNYCYGIIQDVNENIWIGHRKGLSRILHDLSVKSYGKEKGIDVDFNLNAVCKDKNDRIWFGTSDGLIEYDYRYDKRNKIPPYVNIEKIFFSDKEVEFSENIEMPYSVYKLKIEFVGISFSDPGSVKYKYMLKGYDLDWNETSERVVNYKRLEDGDYEFLIKAANADGVWSEKPVSFKIYIKPPLWKRAWFIILVIVIIAYVIYLIIKIRERNHRKLQEYLQKTLDERTREVIKQKEEIELQKNKLEQANIELESKNKDITDSINYAQRIQAAILPHAGKLKEFFNESFIFYRPRDIVSGDFYWFDKMNDKIILICADATGHGVPGAFMSLIGITIIKDLIKTHSLESPAKLLSLLDKEIINTLNQEGINSRWTYDGYDMSICFIDTSENKLIFASAMRPAYLYKNKQLIQLKGTRYPIGGGIIREKAFEDNVIDFKMGDSIYLFSDGYPDQFGGQSGKKMKMNRFKEILLEVANEDFEKQREIIENNFDIWKGNYSQIDDVLVIGVKNS